MNNSKKINGIIYCVTNTITGKQYVGQTIRRFEVRQRQHMRDSQTVDNKLYRAVRKYGWDSFHWGFIVEGVDNMDSLNMLEKFWIAELDTFENGFNSTTGGEGFTISEEVKKKMSEAQKGRVFSEEHRQRLSDAKSGENHHMYGKHHSEEARRKMSKAHKGIPKTEETKKKIGEANSMAILQVNKTTGEVIKEYNSMMEVERDTGICHSSITRCCRGERKTAGGYIWRYKEEE